MGGVFQKTHQENNYTCLRLTSTSVETRKVFDVGQTVMCVVSMIFSSIKLQLSIEIVIF